MKKKRITKKAIKSVTAEKVLIKEMPDWVFKNVPKELIPTKDDVGRLVIRAQDPTKHGSKKASYKILSFEKNNGDTIVHLHATNGGFGACLLNQVILSDKKQTEEEALIEEHEQKKEANEFLGNTRGDAE